MDETTNPEQDNPVVETPEGNKGTTPKKEPETLEEQVKHIKEVAFAEVGRYRVATEQATKSAETAKRAADAAEVRLTKFISEQEEAELEASRDDTDALTRIRAKQRGREQESELTRLKQELEDEKAKTTEAQEADAKHTKEQNAREVASRLKVDAKILLKNTDGSVEAMEDLAKSLLPKGEKKPLVTVSGTTIGGGGSFEQIRDEMIKNPSNDAVMKRYIEAKKARDGQ